MGDKVKEFRGCKNLVFAEVLSDDNESSGGYVVGAVKRLAPVAEISKTVETSSESHFYDNKGRIIINSEGVDSVELTVAIPDDEVLAEITGRTYDQVKKMFIESERKSKYFALGYILGEKGDGEDERFVWRYKGSFNVPDENSKTEDDGTDASNMTLTFSGIYTNHVFANGQGSGVAGSAKAAYIRSSSNIMTKEQWFNTVTTPDTSTPTPSKVATPVFSPESGSTFNDEVEVTLACATTGATIYYTTDGSTPTSSSTVYSGAITLSATTTIKAIAVKAGMTNSDVATGTYTKED